MAFSTVSGGFASIELVCVNEPAALQISFRGCVTLDLGSLPQGTDCILVPLNQQAGIRRLQ